MSSEDAQSIDDIVPNYQDGDFREDNVGRQEFCGPVYRLTYPVFDEALELMFWNGGDIRQAAVMAT